MLAGIQQYAKDVNEQLVKGISEFRDGIEEFNKTTLDLIEKAMPLYDQENRAHFKKVCDSILGGKKKLLLQSLEDVKNQIYGFRLDHYFSNITQNEPAPEQCYSSTELKNLKASHKKLKCEFDQLKKKYQKQQKKIKNLKIFQKICPADRQCDVQTDCKEHEDLIEILKTENQNLVNASIWNERIKNMKDYLQKRRNNDSTSQENPFYNIMMTTSTLMNISEEFKGLIESEEESIDLCKRSNQSLLPNSEARETILWNKIIKDYDGCFKRLKETNRESENTLKLIEEKSIKSLENQSVNSSTPKIKPNFCRQIQHKFFLKIFGGHTTKTKQTATIWHFFL